MSKNKNKHNKKVEEVKEPEVIQQHPEVIQEQPQVQEEVPQETGNKQLPLTTLIAKYINGELPKNTYDVSRIRNENIGTTFEILVSRDESNISRSLPACYLLEANKQYTKTKYCVILNAHVYASMAAIDQNFIGPFICTLSEKLLPDYAFDEEGKCKYDLNLRMDKMACFVNACSESPNLKNKIINYRLVYKNLMGFFTNYLPKGFSSDKQLISVVGPDDVFE